jgi:hypothetical protein
MECEKTLWQEKESMAQKVSLQPQLLHRQTAATTAAMQHAAAASKILGRGVDETHAL